MELMNAFQSNDFALLLLVPERTETNDTFIFGNRLLADSFGKTTGLVLEKYIAADEDELLAVFSLVRMLPDNVTKATDEALDDGELYVENGHRLKRAVVKLCWRL